MTHSTVHKMETPQRRLAQINNSDRKSLVKDQMQRQLTHQAGLSRRLLETSTSSRPLITTASKSQHISTEANITRAKTSSHAKNMTKTMPMQQVPVAPPPPPAQSQQQQEVWNSTEDLFWVSPP